MKWTKEQNEAIWARGSDILVSAAAGSGKTAVLTERIKQLILHDGISVDEMLVVTFSNAAASEMKEKILKSISSEIHALAEENASDTDISDKKREDNRKKVAFLRLQLRKAHSANISTFHKFSMNVIRRFFYLTDVEADFSIGDEARQQILQSEAMDELFESRFAEDDPEFTEFLRGYSDVRSESRVREMILSVYRFIVSMPEPFEWLESACDALGADSRKLRRSNVGRYLAKLTRKSVAEAEALAQTVCDMTQDLPSLQKKALDDFKMIRGIHRKLEEDDGNDSVFAQIQKPKFARFIAAKADKEAYEPLKETIKSLRDAMKKKMSSVNSDFLSLPEDEMIARVNATKRPAQFLCGLVREFHQRFTDKKRERSLLDFNDIEHIALEILSHEEAARDYRERFRVIFVDEYQDSSILQETLLRRIGRGDNIYIVGDVKQSIYKFRLAEPEIFIEKYNTFVPKKFSAEDLPNVRDVKDAAEDLTDAGDAENLPDTKNIVGAANDLMKIADSVSAKNGRNSAGSLSDGAKETDSAKQTAQVSAGRRIDLNRNFRCKRHIINCVNGIFSNIMDRTHGGIEYDENASLKQGVVYEGELDRPVTLHLIDSSVPDGEENLIDEEIAELQKTELEARVTADLVAERIGMEIYDNKSGSVRKVSFGDIAILLRATKGTADIYAEALREQGILSYIDSGEGYFETVEIEVFMNLLRVIDNRRRDVPLISVLRSPIFGLTVGELADIRLNHMEGSYSDAFFACESKKCRVARQKLDEWRLMSRYMPLPDFLWALMRQSGYFEYASALPGGERRAANLSALVDKAAAYAKSQNKGLFGFVRYVESLNENRVSVGQSSQHGGVEDAVRIMTIHKSKGLEFPVVILGGLGRKFNVDRNTSLVTMQKDLGLGLRYSDPDRGCYAKTVVQRVIEKKKEEERLAEEMRILYVAMTRAMDELVMTGSMNGLAEEMEKFRLGLRGATGEPRCFLDWIVPNLKNAGIKTVFYDRLTLSETLKKTRNESAELLHGLEEGFSTAPNLTKSADAPNADIPSESANVRGAGGLREAADTEETGGFPEKASRQNEVDKEDSFTKIFQRFSFRYPYADDVFSKSKFTVSELNRMISGERQPGGTGGDNETDVQVITAEQSTAQMELIKTAGQNDAQFDAARAAEQDAAKIEAAEAETAGANLLRTGNCTDQIPDFLREEAEITPAIRGTLTHRVMEQIPFLSGTDGEDVRKFVDSLVEKNIFTLREAQAVLCDQIASFFRTETGRRACNAHWLRREWPFTLKKDRAELEAMAADSEIAEKMRRELPRQLLIQGIIDCCFEDERGIVIVDYKTDFIDFSRRRESYEEIRNRYRRQVALYRDAVSAALDVHDIETKLFLMRSGEMIDV